MNETRVHLTNSSGVNEGERLMQNYNLIKNKITKTEKRTAALSHLLSSVLFQKPLANLAFENSEAFQQPPVDSLSGGAEKALFCSQGA